MYHMLYLSWVSYFDEKNPRKLFCNYVRVTFTSVSTDSTSSSNTMPTNRLNEQQMDPSNILYNDHQNYQIIFTNDSRFLIQVFIYINSYRKSGYIQSDNIKNRKKSFPSSSNVLKPRIKWI